MSAVERITKRHILRQAQPTIIWEPHHFLEIPEAESVNVLPYIKWLDLFRRLESDDLTSEDLKTLLKEFQIDEYIPASKSLSQPLR